MFFCPACGKPVDPKDGRVREFGCAHCLARLAWAYIGPTRSVLVVYATPTGDNTEADGYCPACGRKLARGGTCEVTEFACGKCKHRTAMTRVGMSVHTVTPGMEEA